MGKPLLHICYAPADHAWVHGRMLPALGLEADQYHTRADDALGELQLQEIARAVNKCRFTLLIASTAARWDKLAQFAAALGEHVGLEGGVPRLVIVARDFALDSETAQAQLSLGRRALVGLDCSDESHTVEALARLRKLLALDEPIDERPVCPYPGLACFTAANRDLLFGRDRDKDAILQRIRARQTRILVVGPSGSGKSSLIHAAVLPELDPRAHVVRVVTRSADLAAALGAAVEGLEVAGLGIALDRYVTAARNATDAEIDHARARLRTAVAADARRRIIVVDRLEEVFVQDDATARQTAFLRLCGLWSLPWCTVVLCMRADFYAALMVERCWRELENSQYAVAPLDETGLRAAIVEPAGRVGVHVDAALVERLIREIDRDRSSVPLPLLQVALKELWAQLRWRYLTLADYDRIVDHDQRGLAAVLAVHAEAVVQSLATAGDRAVAQRILLDLVHLCEGRPHTRRRRTVDDLRRTGDAPNQVERVLATLAAGRLVTTSDGDRDTPRASGGEHHDRYVDLAHDTLITGWPALASWIFDRRDDLRTQRRLEARAEMQGLLTASELPEFLRWLRWTATPPGQALGTSEALRTLVRRSLAMRRLRRGVLGIAPVVIAVAIVFGCLFMQLRVERAKTLSSITQAARIANVIVFEIDIDLQPVAGASSLRDRLLKNSRTLLTALNKLGELSERDRRTEMAGKMAQADLARERGRLEDALALYQEIVADALRRAAEDPRNTTWQRDLAFAYYKLGNAAMSAGKPDDARAWLTRALAVRKELTAADPANTQWQRDLSLSFERLGDVAISAGKLDEARTWFDSALAIRKALAEIDPGNTSWQRDLSVSYERVGDVAVSAGRLDDARTWLDRALAIHLVLAGSEPGNTIWQRDLALSYERLGDLALLAGNLEDAGVRFDQALTVRQALVAADSSNTGGQRDLAVSYNKLGDVALAAGKLDDARAWFDSALAIRRDLAVADPSDKDWQRDLAVSYNKLGDVAATANRPEEARTWFARARAVAAFLAASDPTNTEWRRDLAMSCERSGDLALSTGDVDDARTFFRSALTARQALVAADPTNTTWQRDLSLSYNKLGAVAMSAGDLDDARAWFERGLEVRKTLATADPTNTTWRRDLSVSYERLGDLAGSAGRLGDARAWFDKDLAIATELAAADPANTTWQRDLAVSYTKLGDVAMAAGDRRVASAWFDKALTLHDKLATVEPTNTTWQRDLSVSYDRLGNVAMSAGKLDQARVWYRRALRISRTLATAEPANTGWQRELCAALAKLALVTPAPREAMRHVDEARAIYDELGQGPLFQSDPAFSRIGAMLNEVMQRAARASRRHTTSAGQQATTES